MTSLLQIGTRWDGKPMTLPADLGDKKIALVAQSNKGKTYGLGDILEELCKARRPFIATDPANNLWGLRVKPDGTPSGLPVVVIGGPHGDIQIEKEAGERIAEALLATPQCAILDISAETAGTYRRFMTDLAGRLIRTRCEFSLPIFLEEAPVLVPQKAFGPAMEICKSAVSKLATVGGNFGYGVFPASQRPATIDKDILSQCEALIVMGITHGPDRKAIRDWIDAKDLGQKLDGMFSELGSLEPGQAWLWWPGEDRFEKFTFRKRETLHPREMKRLGLEQSAVQLGDARAFVEKLKADLARTVVHVQGGLPKNPKTRDALLGMAKLAGESMAPARREYQEQAVEVDRLKAEVTRLSGELQAERGRAREAERRLDAVRARLRPEYDALATLFEDLGEVPGAAAADRGVYEPWLAKIGKKGCRQMLEVLVDRRELTKNQLGTLSGVSPKGGTFGSYLSWLRVNGLIETDGEMVRLRAV